MEFILTDPASPLNPLVMQGTQPERLQEALVNSLVWDTGMKTLRVSS